MNVIMMLVLLFVSPSSPANVYAQLNGQTVTLHWVQQSNASIVYIYQISDFGKDTVTLEASTPGQHEAAFQMKYTTDYLYFISEGYMNEQNEFYCTGFYMYRDLLHLTFIPLIQRQ